MPRTVASFALALGTLLPVVLAAAPDDAFERQVRRRAEEVRRRFHYPAEHVPGDAIVEEARAARAREVPESRILEHWVPSWVHRSFYSFAPETAAHDAATRYRLPYRSAIPRLVTQAVGDEPTHRDPRSFYAFDFILPPGADVLAAREGVVARVVDGIPSPDRMIVAATDGKITPANVVFVLHDDGTFASYLHLRSGIPVREGIPVKRGQLLAHSGDSGSPSGPHLHFSVDRRLPGGRIESLPIRFGQPGQEGIVPEANEWYGTPPNPNVALELSLGGKPVDLDAPTVVPPGAVPALQVMLVGLDGRRRDVTRHRATRVQSMTPWSVVVSGQGRIRITKGRGYEAVAKGPHFEFGMVQVVHVNRERKEIGRVAFTVREGEAP
jgi:murein DD-endopeptidase MepM/ murein hydrolase activator NlpD